MQSERKLSAGNVESSTPSPSNKKPRSLKREHAAQGKIVPTMKENLMYAMRRAHAGGRGRPWRVT